MKKFNPTKLKFLIEQSGQIRPTDKQLAVMLNVRINTIAVWKVNGVPLFDKIYATGIKFDTFMKLDKDVICKGLGYSTITAYRWNKAIPNTLQKLQKILKKYNIKFEDIYLQ